ncbi:unnamed protein product, partial [Didymodactylos carnosus]
MSPGYLQ